MLNFSLTSLSRTLAITLTCFCLSVSTQARNQDPCPTHEPVALEPRQLQQIQWTDSVCARLSPTQSPSPSPMPIPSSIPQNMKLPSFYSKYLDSDGIPVVASKEVSDPAFQEVSRLEHVMLAHRPDLLRAMKQNRLQISIIGRNEMTLDIPEHAHLKDSPSARDWNATTRGLGATLENPVSSTGEENLLCLPGNHYPSESIFIHEFTHSIHLLGIMSADHALATQISQAYADAKQKGLWRNTYAATNEQEYLAEGAQAWFDAGKKGKTGGDGNHNEVATRDDVKSYDPELAAVLTQIFGDTPWRYHCP